MKIRELKIRNFKSLVNFELKDVPNLAVIAGPQGSGKSSALEAVAYFKENLGPYYSAWTSPDVVNALAPFAEITIGFDVYPEEKEYLQKAHNLTLSGNQLTGSVRIEKNGHISQQNCPNELRILLRAYDDHKSVPGVGIFEYIHPHRVMRKKPVTSLVIGGFSDPEEKMRRIVQVETKFDMIKDYIAQLAMTDLQKIDNIVRSEKRSVSVEDIDDSLEPIKSIFNELLSPKRLAYVDFSSRPLKVVVATPQGDIDIDNLSSGEKEILFVFTELLRLNLKNSIILFDEPDLHLNQEVERRIVDQLKELGSNNQFILTTHSFGIMGSVGYDQLFRIDHYAGSNQVTRVFDDQEKYETFKSVAGDVGIVTLGEKIVFLEGAEGADKFILDSWYSKYKGKVTFVSCGSVSNIMGTSEKTLDLLTTSSRFNFFYAIRDRDFLTDEKREDLIRSGNSRLFVWSRYHIENYLLDFDVVHTVLAKAMGADNPCSDPKDVFEKMENVLLENKERFISKLVSSKLNSVIRNVSVSIGFPDVRTHALEKSKNASQYLTESLSEKKVEDLVTSATREFESSIREHTWVSTLPGRDILKLFLGKYIRGLAYEQFKNLLASEITSQGKIPKEVEDTINQIAT